MSGSEYAPPSGCALRPLMRQERPGRIERIALDLRNCAEGWEADACLLGNVKAEEIRDLCQWVIEHNAAVEARRNAVASDGLLAVSDSQPKGE